MPGPKALYRQRLGIAQPEDGVTQPLQQLTSVGERKAEEQRRRARPKQPIKPNGDGLTDWLIKHLNQAWSPKSARELVDAWYAHWRGRLDKPEGIIKKNKTHHVDRVSKWLERKVQAGEMAVYDTGGEWNAKRYYKPDGVRLRQRGAPLSAFSSDVET
jgi:hypothetical protein